MDGKRFPPPGGELGYREPAAPAAPEPPPEPAPARDGAHHHHLVVARPDDPDVARNKAAMEDPYIRRQEARIRAREIAQRRITWLAIAVAVAWVLLRVFACHH